MRSYTINILFIAILLCILASCSQYHYIPQTSQSNKQVETFYQEQDLSSSKGSRGIEPYRNTIENEVNNLKGNNLKEGINKFQKSIRSTRQAYLVKAIVKKITKIQGRRAIDQDSTTNKKQPKQTVNLTTEEGFTLSSILIGLIGVMASSAAPTLAMILGLLSSLIGLGLIIYFIHDWYSKQKKHSPLLWFLCVFGLILGIVAMYLGLLEGLKEAFGNFNMGSGNYI
jgi:hypothetical protein